MSEENRKTYVLKKPVKQGSDPIAEFHMRDFRAKDLRGLGGLSDEEKALKLIARMSGQTDDVVDQLCGEDLVALSLIVNASF